MATSSKLYHQLTSSFLLLHRATSRTYIKAPIKISPLSSLRPFASLYCGTRSFAATATDDDASVPLPSPPRAHPWPEWDQFVEKMRNKGYFAKTLVDTSSNAEASASSYSSASMELNRVKNACLSFARERYDIIRSLPKEDIQAIVESGCPNLFRKAVNSAKRLRAFLRLDEGDVCGACNLRGSCDRAYVIEKDDDKARTVDIMRILMTYAVDPGLHSGEANPSMTEHVQESARKLLGELIKLSDTTIDPDLPKPEVNPPSKKKPIEKSQVVSNSKRSQNVEMKRGDWICSKCNFLNFARNTRCLECKAEGPARTEFSSAEKKLGDWNCPQCNFMNFARNRRCFRCSNDRPPRELNPGEWECPKCSYLNFKRNPVCKKCNCQPPDHSVDRGIAGHAWENPRKAFDNDDLKFGDDGSEKEDNDNEFDDSRFRVTKARHQQEERRVRSSGRN